MEYICGDEATTVKNILETLSTGIETDYSDSDIDFNVLLSMPNMSLVDCSVVNREPGSFYFLKKSTMMSEVDVKDVDNQLTCAMVMQLATVIGERFAFVVKTNCGWKCKSKMYETLDDVFVDFRINTHFLGVEECKLLFVIEGSLPINSPNLTQDDSSPSPVITVEHVGSTLHIQIKPIKEINTVTVSGRKVNLKEGPINFTVDSKAQRQPVLTLEDSCFKLQFKDNSSINDSSSITITNLGSKQNDSATAAVSRPSLHKSKYCKPLQLNVSAPSTPVGIKLMGISSRSNSSKNKFNPPRPISSTSTEATNPKMSIINPVKATTSKAQIPKEAVSTTSTACPQIRSVTSMITEATNPNMSVAYPEKATISKAQIPKEAVSTTSTACPQFPMPSTSVVTPTIQRQTMSPTLKLRQRVELLIKNYFNDFRRIDVKDVSEMKNRVPVDGLRSEDYNVLLCYNKDFDCLFAVSLPHPGNHEGLVICKYSEVDVPLCLEVVKQKDTLCHRHPQKVTEHRRIDYVAAVRAFLSKLCSGGNLTEEIITDCIQEMKLDYQNVYILHDSVILTTLNNKLLFYGLVTNEPMKQLCGVDGCTLICEKIGENESCVKHNRKLRYFAISVGDKNNDKIIFFTSIRTSTVNKDGTPHLDCLLHHGRDYKQRLKSKNEKWIPVIRRSLELPNYERAEETINCWAFVQVIRELDKPEEKRYEFINKEIRCPNDYEALRQEMVESGVSVRVNPDMITPSTPFFLCINPEAMVSDLKDYSHCYRATTPDGCSYIGFTVSTHIIDPHHKKPGSVLFLYLEKGDRLEETIQTISITSREGKQAETLLIISDVLNSCYEQYAKKNHQLNTIINLNTIGGTLKLDDLIAFMHHLSKKQVDINIEEYAEEVQHE